MDPLLDRLDPGDQKRLRRAAMPAFTPPMLATLTPENQMGIRGLAWSLVPMINDQIRALAASEGVPLVDVYQAFGGDVTTLIGFDGLHPTAAGYAKIADIFFNSIDSWLRGGPGALWHGRITYEVK